MAKIKIHVETVHKKLRKFKCQLCVADDKNGSPHGVPTFLTKGHLDSHIDSFHKQLRPHVCHMCGLAFARFDHQLNSILLTVHNQGSV